KHLRRARAEQKRDKTREREEQRSPALSHETAFRTSSTNQETANAAGIVRSHAHTTRPATPHLTADSRLVVPTPTIAPVIVCVVETGIPACAVKNSVAAAADSALIPATGCSFVMREPMVCTIRHPPAAVPP